ncbi:MAG TPA: phenylalanine--tRNA ligase beta subunit-related protein [Gemmataceae bacterium]|jgi:DNA/RNA-binding domain of Phe-tRNA-synthetase-like protein|nr:phenylalanine--tRNA ligase beta subunit-related protein [Gemmataceae bacterium]
MIEIRIDNEVIVRWQGEAALGFCVLGGLGTGDPGPRFQEEIEGAQADAATVSADDLIVAAVRATFRSMPDMDPTRYRPASEALIRRVAEKGLVHIHPLVDLNNRLSIRYRIPLGIYDLGRVEGVRWDYRLGRAGEAYTTIGGQTKSAAGKLVLTDADGVIGSPVADAGRAPVGPQTCRIVVIAYLPFGTSESSAATVTAAVEAAFVENFAAAPEGRGVVCIPRPAS